METPFCRRCQKVILLSNSTVGLHLINGYRYKSLKLEQEVVYSLIDEAGSEGLWTKTIKARSQLHDAIFRAAIKFLESRNMISDMKSVEHPTRKMYIKSTLRPSDRATGGPWYTDGELDVPFIDHIKSVCEGYINRRTFYQSSTVPNPIRRRRDPVKVNKANVEEAKAARDQALGPRSKSQMTESQKKQNEKDRKLPMPAGYKDYPTCDELTAHIDNLKITQVILTAVDIQQLLDILAFDGKIERIMSGDGEWAYRMLRKSLRENDIGQQNLTEAPCGRCPVFDLCEEGGPVGPSNCEYFTDWLTL